MVGASVGRLLVPQAWRAVRVAFERTSQAIRQKLPSTARVVEAELQPIFVRNAAARQPIPRWAAVRQSQSRWLSSSSKFLNNGIRRFTTAQQPTRSRASYPVSRTATAVSQLTSRTPFASTLRPNLTGGTLCRSAGGYGTGAGRVGGARFFSHSPAAPAEVVNNVSAAVRAFWLAGQRVKYDGVDQHGNTRFKTVGAKQDRATKAMSKFPPMAPGSHIDFKLNPTITAIGALNSTSLGENTLGQDGVLDAISGDFARALKDFAVISQDLKKLQAVGHLSLSNPMENILRVHFPGCDAESVEALCSELGLQRGLISQDPEFNEYHGTEMALMFPYAPSQTCSDIARHAPTRMQREEQFWHDIASPTELVSSDNLSEISAGPDDLQVIEPQKEDTHDSDYSSLQDSEIEAELFYYSTPAVAVPEALQQSQTESEYRNGIYGFIEEFEHARNLRSSL